MEIAADSVECRGKNKGFVKNRQIVSKINTIKVDKEILILQLSTSQKSGNALKSSYTQSYTHYPLFFVWKTLIYIMRNKTDVLYICDKSNFRSK